MIVDDYTNYRAEGYLTLVVWDDDQTPNPKFLMIPEDYEVLEKENKESALASRRIMHLKQLKNYLRIKVPTVKDINLMLDASIAYGGVNINPETGAWKGFINLKPAAGSIKTLDQFNTQYGY